MSERTIMILIIIGVLMVLLGIVISEIEISKLTQESLIINRR